MNQTIANQCSLSFFYCCFSTVQSEMRLQSFKKADRNMDGVELLLLIVFHAKIKDSLFGIILYKPM